MTKKNKKTAQAQRLLNSSKYGYNNYVWYALSVIAITTVIIYVKAIKFNFIYNWDDQDYIIGNADIKSITLNNIQHFFVSFYNSNYQPVTMLLYAIEYKLGNGSPAVFHFVNILLHLVNSFLVFKLIWIISNKNTIVSLTVTSLFAVHPMHVESVMWISELKDVLYSFFFLLGLIVYIRFTKTNKTKDLVIVLCFFLLSCLSKSAAVIFPVVLLLMDFYFDRKFTGKTIIEKIPFFAISLVFGIVAIRSQGGAIKEMAPDMSVLNHMAVVTFSFCSYLVKAVLPINMAALYPYPVELQSTLPVVYYLSVLLLILIFVFVWFSKKWGKELLFGFLFFVINIILVIQFVPVGAASMADRYTYISYIGLFFILGYFINFIHIKYSAHKNIVYSVLILCFITLSGISYARVNVWKNDDSLFTDVIKKYPHCSIAYLNRGTYFYNNLSVTDSANKNSNIQKAITDFENGLKYPVSDVNKARAYLALGKANLSLNNVDQAVLYLNKSIATDSTFWANAYIERGNIYLNHYAGRGFINDTLKKNDYLRKAITDYKLSLPLIKQNEFKSVVYYNTGMAQSQLGNFKEAIINVDSAIKYNPHYIDAYFNRCSYKIAIGDNTGAIADCDLVINIDPQNLKAHFNKAYIKYNTGDFNGAIDAISIVLNLDKNNATAYTLRANAYANLKNYSNALTDYNNAIALNPNDIVALNNRERIILLNK